MAKGYFEFPLEPALGFVPEKASASGGVGRFDHIADQKLAGRAWALIYLAQNREEKAWSLEEADEFACTVLNLHPGLIWGDLYWEGPPKPSDAPERAIRCASCRRWGVPGKQGGRYGAKANRHAGYLNLRARSLCEGCYHRALKAGELDEWESQSSRWAKTPLNCRDCGTEMMGRKAWLNKGKPFRPTYHHGKGFCRFCYNTSEKAREAKKRERAAV